MAQWYYTKNGQQAGPVDQAELGRLVSSGQVTASDLVWKDGMANWQTISTVPELSGASAGAAAYSQAPYGQTGYAQAGYAQGTYPQAGYPQAGYPQPGYAQPGYGHTPGAPLGYYTPQQPAFVYAGFWMRFAAAFIDGLIINVPFFIVRLVIQGGDLDNRHMSPEVAGIVLLLNLLNIVASWLYFALQESAAPQATLGKRALGIRVTDLNGQRITFGRATGRYFGKILSGCTLFIGYIMAGFTERKQALHDMMAGTLVIRG